MKAFPTLQLHISISLITNHQMLLSADVICQRGFELGTFIIKLGVIMFLPTKL